MTTAGKVVVITGGSSGIGKQLAQDLCGKGAHVVISSHNQERLQTAVRELTSKNCKVSSVVCDVARQEQVDELASAVVSEFGRVDVLINNAGYAVYETFEESTIDELVRLVEVNLLGVIRCTKAFLPLMIERRQGRIVNMASIAGRLVITPNATYGSAKHGMVALTRALSYELGRFGIKTNVVCPGRVETPFFDHPSFQKRAARPETRLTVSMERVSRATIHAIEQDRFLTYVPRSLGVIVWLVNAVPFVSWSLYRSLQTRRVESLYVATDSIEGE